MKKKPEGKIIRLALPLFLYIYRRPTPPITD